MSRQNTALEFTGLMAMLPANKFVKVKGIALHKIKSMNWTRVKQLRAERWIILPTALAFATRLYHLGEQSLWFDEIVTVVMAQASWLQGLEALLGQGIQLTPVFHWTIKLWMTLGDTDWLLRVPAAMVGALTIPVMFRLGRHYFDNRVGLLAALVFAINPYQVWYGQELKLYALLPLAAAGAMFAFGQMLCSRGQRGCKKLIVFNLIGLPAHYFMFSISTIQFFYLLITFNRTYSILRRWAITQVVGIIPLVPWWLFIFYSKNLTIGVGWVAPPSWRDIFLTFWNFSFAYTGELSVITAIALGIMPVGIGLGLWHAGRIPFQGLLMTLWLLFPPIIILFISRRNTSLYVDRYFLVIAPVLTLLIIAGLVHLRPHFLGWGMLIIFMVATGLGLWRIYFDRANFAKENWRAIARKIDALAGLDDLVVTCTGGHRLALEYYNPHHNLTAEDVLDISQLADTSRLTAFQAAWVITVHQPLPVHYLAKTVSPALDRTSLPSKIARWQTNNLQNVITVSGISAYRYYFANPSFLTQVATWHCQS